MSADFFDSNALLYLAASETPKAEVIEKLLLFRPTISAQVLNEITSVLRRKYRLDWSVVNRFVDRLVPATEVVPVTAETNRLARSLAKRHGFAFYDAVIVASALDANCDRLVTEDLQHGQKIGSLTVFNPFR